MNSGIFVASFLKDFGPRDVINCIIDSWMTGILLLNVLYVFVYSFWKSDIVGWNVWIQLISYV